MESTMRRYVVTGLAAIGLGMTTEEEGDMVRKRQVSFTRSALQHGLHWRVAALCAALLSAGPVVPAHAQHGNWQAVTVAMAPTKNAKEAEAALELTRSQRVWVQKGLNALNFDVGASDGIFGPRTRAAIARWQSARGEPPTGYLDTETAEMLIAVGKGASPSEAQADAGKPSTTAQSAAEEEPKTQVEPTAAAGPVVPEEAIAALNGAVSTARGIANYIERVDVLSSIATAQAQAGDTQSATQTITEALSIARGISSDSSRARTLSAIAPAQAQAGDTHGAARTIAEALSAAWGVSDDWHRANVLSRIAAAQALSGNTQDALSTARGLGDNYLRGTAFGAIAAAQAQAGDTHGASRTIAEALSTARRIASDWLRAKALTGIAAAQAHAGNTHGAVRTATDALSITRGVGSDSQRGETLSAIAAVQAQAGDTHGASRTIAEALSVARSIGSGLVGDKVLSFIATAQAQAGDIQGAQDIARTISTTSMRARALSAIGIAVARAQIAAQTKPAPTTQTASTGSGAASTTSPPKKPAATQTATTGSGSAVTAAVNHGGDELCVHHKRVWDERLEWLAKTGVKDQRMGWHRSAVQGTNYQDQRDCIEASKERHGAAWWWSINNVCAYPIIAGTCVKSGGERVKPHQFCDPKNPKPTELGGPDDPRVTTSVLGPPQEAFSEAYTKQTLENYEYFYWAFTCVP